MIKTRQFDSGSLTESWCELQVRFLYGGNAKVGPNVVYGRSTMTMSDDRTTQHVITKWLVEIEDDIISVESADDLRDAILDGYGYPVTLDAHPEKLKVTRLEPDE